MKLKVIEQFIDKFNGAVHNVGEVNDFADDRAADLIERQLAAPAEEPPKKKAASKKK